MIKILLADKQNLVRAGLKSLLNKEKDLDVCAEAHNSETALQALRKHQPQVTLLEAGIPGLGGLDVVKRSSRYAKQTKIIVLDTNVQSPLADRYIRLGVAGYLLKTTSQEELISCIHQVHNGHPHIAAEVAQALALKQLNPTFQTPLDQLSNRELQIMSLIAQGENAETIANHLHLGSKTIHTHRYHIFDKLKAENDVQLTYLAVKYGLLDMAIDPEAVDLYTTHKSPID